MIINENNQVPYDGATFNINFSLRSNPITLAMLILIEFN